jgi:putative membrane protein
MVKTTIASILGCTAMAVALSTVSLNSSHSRLWAADASGNPTEVRGSLSKKDFSFAETATAAGIHEVAEGKLAVSQGSTDEIKKFGQKMIDDHSAANDELAAILKSKGVTVPMQETKGQIMDTDKLGKYQGADFDKEYIKLALADHKQAVKLFTKESQNGDDADLKAFAAKTLPILQGHLDMVKAMYEGKSPSMNMAGNH